MDLDLRQEIKNRIRLEELIGSHVALRRSGQSFKGLCPFHAEKTPSFSVNPERGFWRCYGCGIGGDVFDFVTRMENISFPEAMERLAARVGLTYTRRGEGKERASERQRLLDINALAARFFTEQLRRQPAAGDYLRRRGLDDEMLAAFQLGYAPPGWEALTTWLRGQKADLEAARLAGLVRAGPEGGLRDYFHDRIVIPIRSADGRVVGFGARALRAEATPKYLNTPETPVFQKGRLWFGLDRARQPIAALGRAVAVEGYMDVIALHQAGITHAIAAMGTAITPQQVELLRRYAADLVLAYDGDSAGIQAALNNAAMFEVAECAVRVARLPGGLDPDTLVREQGAPAFHLLEREALPLLDFRIELIRERHDLTDPAARLAMVREAAQAVAQSRSHLVREEYAGKINRLVPTLVSNAGVDQQQSEQAALLAEIRRIALGFEAARRRGQVLRGESPGPPRPAGPPDSRRGNPASLPPDAGAPAPPAAPGRGQQLAEEYVLRAVLTDPRWSEAVLPRLRPELFSDEGYRRIASALAENPGNNSKGANAVLQDPQLAGELSRLLAADELLVDAAELSAHLERLEQLELDRRFALLREMVDKGTLQANDQRYQEFLQIGLQLRAKG